MRNTAAPSTNTCFLVRAMIFLMKYSQIVSEIATCGDSKSMQALPTILRLKSLPYRLLQDEEEDADLPIVSVVSSRYASPLAEEEEEEDEYWPVLTSASATSESKPINASLSTEPKEISMLEVLNCHTTDASYLAILFRKLSCCIDCLRCKVCMHTTVALPPAQSSMWRRNLINLAGSILSQWYHVSFSEDPLRWWLQSRKQLLQQFWWRPLHCQSFRQAASHDEYRVSVPSKGKLKAFIYLGQCGIAPSDGY